MIEKIITNTKAQGQKIFKSAIDNLTEKGLSKNSSKSVFDNLKLEADKTEKTLNTIKKNIYNSPEDVARNTEAIEKVLDKTKHIDSITDKVFGEGASGNIKLAAKNNVLMEDIGATNLHASRDYLKAYASSTLGAYGSKAKQMFGDYYLKPTGLNGGKANIKKASMRIGVSTGITAGAIGGVGYMASHNNDEIMRY